MPSRSHKHPLPPTSHHHSLHFSLPLPLHLLRRHLRHILHPHNQPLHLRNRHLPRPPPTAPNREELPAGRRRDPPPPDRPRRRRLREARLRVLLGGPVHRRRRPESHRRAVAAAQRRQIRLQRAEEDLEEGKQGFHEIFHQSGVDEEAGELGGGAVQLPEFSDGVHMGDGGGAAAGASAADECAERNAAAGLHSQPPGFRRR